MPTSTLAKNNAKPRFKILADIVFIEPLRMLNLIIPSIIISPYAFPVIINLMSLSKNIRFIDKQNAVSLVKIRLEKYIVDRRETVQSNDCFFVQFDMDVLTRVR